MSVYVLNQRNQPLMPTTSRKARVLLKQGKAKVVRVIRKGQEFIMGKEKAGSGFVRVGIPLMTEVTSLQPQVYMNKYEEITDYLIKLIQGIRLMCEENKMAQFENFEDEVIKTIDRYLDDIKKRLQ